MLLYTQLQFLRDLLGSNRVDVSYVCHFTFTMSIINGVRST